MGARIATKGRALSDVPTTFEETVETRWTRARGGGRMAKKDVPPRWDRKMQQRLARGEAAALGELYDRFASLVHSQAPVSYTHLTLPTIYSV